MTSTHPHIQRQSQHQLLVRSRTRARLANARLWYTVAKSVLATVPCPYLPHVTKGHALAECKKAKRELREAVRVVETKLGRENRENRV